MKELWTISQIQETLANWQMQTALEKLVTLNVVTYENVHQSRKQRNYRRNI